MADKVMAPTILAMKGREQRIVCLTAYDFPTCQIADRAGVDVILVGDSLGNVVLGYETTVPVSLDDMIHHTRAAARAKPRALLLSDLPFGSYQISTADAVASAVELAKAGAEAVKLEGAYTDEIAAIVRAGIPVMGHVGLTPQSVNEFGGFRVQGKGEQAKKVMEQALAIEAAGAFGIVIELIPAALAKEITHALRIPTIGIGAGAECDGQVQVFHDLLGFSGQKYKHIGLYAHAAHDLQAAVERYTADVRESRFPTSENSF